MNLKHARQEFDRRALPEDRAKPTFLGVDGYDVYNSSIPFHWHGKRYIFGRVERRNEWTRSWVRLFEETAPDEWTVVHGSMIYQLEDPYVAIINNELVMGGTHARFNKGELDTYYGYFYRGKDIHDLYYFTTGPDYMKDIRLVEMLDGRVGVFSRPRSEEILKKYGSESMVGFQIINSLDDLSSEIVSSAPLLSNMFDKEEWGGCNQAYCLDSGLIGMIGHKCYKEGSTKVDEQLVYLNVSWVLDPKNNKIVHEAIIATRKTYPDGPAKRPHLEDCAFTSGIVSRDDGFYDLYSGIGDTEVGRVKIADPFLGYGRILSQEKLDAVLV